MLELIVSVIVFFGMLTIALFGVHALSKYISSTISSLKENRMTGNANNEQKIIDGEVVNEVPTESTTSKMHTKWETFKAAFKESFKERIIAGLKFMGIGGLMATGAAAIFVLIKAPHIFGMFFIGSGLIATGLAIAAVGTGLSAVVGMIFGGKKHKPTEVVCCK